MAHDLVNQRHGRSGVLLVTWVVHARHMLVLVAGGSLVLTEQRMGANEPDREE
jgi:hypothetical protein